MIQIDLNSLILKSCLDNNDDDMNVLSKVLLFEFYCHFLN